MQKISDKKFDEICEKILNSPYSQKVIFNKAKGIFCQMDTQKQELSDDAIEMTTTMATIIYLIKHLSDSPQELIQTIEEFIKNKLLSRCNKLSNADILRCTNISMRKAQEIINQQKLNDHCQKP